MDGERDPGCLTCTKGPRVPIATALVPLQLLSASNPCSALGVHWKEIPGAVDDFKDIGTSLVIKNVLIFHSSVMIDDGLTTLYGLGDGMMDKDRQTQMGAPPRKVREGLLGV
ncbi:hypothetical protein VTL71DRAFT_994 [Oculimacula yallundae]|uniref:Uncharacterized protein n=1 Tax=Oculimacula yallundae TaxID=86028 RepID=A0ABR4D3W8_9HELO